MICLNKADEGSFKHLFYNQSPPALAADGTTCQDLNGISNLREHVKAGQDGAGGGSLFDPTASNETQCPDDQQPGLGVPNMGRRWPKGLSSRLVTAAGGEDQNRLSMVPTPSCASQLWSWTTWLLSVAIVSFCMSNIMPFYGNFMQASQPANPATRNLSSSSPVIEPTVSEPLRLRKRDTCASGGISKDEFNMPLHAGAILIIWFVSTTACAFPILASKFPGLRIPPRFFFVVRHFGTGVLIATAFVHLLPTAFGSLGNPCLGDFWTEDYPAMPGAIALAAIFFVTVIEMIFHPGRHEPSPPAVDNQCSADDTDLEMVVSAPAAGAVPVREVRPPFKGRTLSIGHGLSQLNQDSLEQIRAASRLQEEAQAKPASAHVASSSSSQDTLSPEQKQRKERLQCVLLEMGILFHSIFIGMALSVSVGNSFIILLIAIIFHQMFEGLALGARISTINWTKQTKQPWVMAIAYGLTTPIGQAIGLGMHSLYSPDSEVGLIVVGVMNAVSAGLLTFASLVELLSEDFLSDDSWRYLRGKRRVCACLLVFFGAFLMSLVGAWA
ncbi:Zinc-regulated transporter [Paramyrothecium foliicola]|nr:Zinc-regulated transporter [Paramyrothecium foliicola]